MNHHEMLRAVSRTFALSIEQLPGILRETVTIAYLMFRVSDAIEDHPTLSCEQKASLLTVWAQVLAGESGVGELTGRLEGLDENDPEVYVATHADRVLEYLYGLPDTAQAICARHVRDTSLGMARWQMHGPVVSNEAEMDDYMHQVAGRVGYLLTELFSWYCPAIEKLKERLMPLAREFGLALQTVNIIRGIKNDYERGWVFIPATFYRQFGLNSNELFSADKKDHALEVVDMISRKAERHLQNGLTYITLLPRFQRRIRLFCIWPLLFAVKTLSISRNNPAVLTAEAKISRSQVRSIIMVSQACFWSNYCLSRYYNFLNA